jgi:predicted nucleic acid-binding protein
LIRRFVVDSSPLILLSRISQLDLLPRLAEVIAVPRSVVGELQAKLNDPLAQILAEHPGFRIVENEPIPAKVVTWNLGAGETSVLAYCMANEGHRAVLDDQRGRRCAQALGVPLFGTLGVVVEARRRGFLLAARPVLAALEQVGFRIEQSLLGEALRQVGE